MGDTWVIMKRLILLIFDSSWGSNMTPDYFDSYGLRSVARAAPTNDDMMTFFKRSHVALVTSALLARPCRDGDDNQH